MLGMVPRYEQSPDGRPYAVPSEIRIASSTCSMALRKGAVGGHAGISDAVPMKFLPRAPVSAWSTMSRASPSPTP